MSRSFAQRMADAGAMVVAATWHRSRAGSAEHHYDYEPLPGITSGGSSVYTCSRGRGDESGLLYLYLDAETGCWNAKSVDGEVANACDIEEFGRPAFPAHGEPCGSPEFPVDDLRPTG